MLIYRWASSTLRPLFRIPRTFSSMFSPGLSPAEIQSHLYTSLLQASAYDVTIRIKGTWKAVYKLHRVVLIQSVFPEFQLSIESHLSTSYRISFDFYSQPDSPSHLSDVDIPMTKLTLSLMTIISLDQVRFIRPKFTIELL